MKIDDFTIDNIGGKLICIAGIGKLFYQGGFPISMAVAKLKEHGVEVSILHVADECLKNGWSPKTTVTKISADFEDDIDKAPFDRELLKTFCEAEYMDQREMIYKSLFGAATEAEQEFFVAKHLLT